MKILRLRSGFKYLKLLPINSGSKQILKLNKILIFGGIIYRHEDFNRRR